MKSNGKRAALYKGLLAFQSNLYTISQVCCIYKYTPMYLQVDKDLNTLIRTKKWKKTDKEAFIKRLKEYDGLQSKLANAALDLNSVDPMYGFEPVPNLVSLLEEGVTISVINDLVSQMSSPKFNGMKGLLKEEGIGYYTLPLTEKYVDMDFIDEGDLDD